jgi:hypothetical protein
VITNVHTVGNYGHWQRPKAAFLGCLRVREYVFCFAITLGFEGYSGKRT